MPLYPLFLDLEGREVLVVGAGWVGTRKIEELVLAGAAVRVVAPVATETVRARAADGSVKWAERAFEPEDVEGAWLVVAATADKEVQRAVARAAEARRVFLVAVDDVKNTSAYGASVVRRAPLTVAISSNGEAPALVRLMRELLEQILPDDDWVRRARALREEWRAKGVPIGDRFGELVRDFTHRARSL
jgi:uroporphyrin-III C-methyltransferase / precorrin-2 dehydrogenase / sirohydrochlorin ferrochelatase